GWPNERGRGSSSSIPLGFSFASSCFGTREEPRAVPCVRLDAHNRNHCSISGTMAGEPSVDLNEILVFTHVARTGSFTAAARELSMPKSTVSRKVAELERRLGARLLQ